MPELKSVYPPEAAPPTISIIIKALNEERHIAVAIESALAALEGLPGEVILADSASTDRTLEIAAKYPINIVQLTKIEDRSCGAGVQLGYQYSTGCYICLIDGDMQLRREFLPAAMRFLNGNPEVAGVSGRITEHEKENIEYVRRAAEYVQHQPGLVTCLNGGGLYRRSAIESAGYFGDCNLHAGEESDLAMRLQVRGWKLVRLEAPFVDHHGHSESSYGLLLRRFKNRYAFGIGEILHAGCGQPHFWALLRHMRKLILQLSVVYAWWLSLLIAPLFASGIVAAICAFGALALLPFAVLGTRCRSLSIGAYAVANWNVWAAGFWPGLLRRRSNPAGWIESIVVREGPTIIGGVEQTFPVLSVARGLSYSSSPGDFVTPI
jgi:glycosyltransferase involved in cell wall biosynthesis